jgi:hypothetical protein
MIMFDGEHLTIEKYLTPTEKHSYILFLYSELQRHLDDCLALMDKIQRLEIELELEQNV